MDFRVKTQKTFPFDYIYGIYGYIRHSLSHIHSHSFRNQNLILICLRICLCVCIFFFRRFCLLLRILDEVKVLTSDNIFTHQNHRVQKKNKFFLFTIAFENKFFFLFDSSLCFPLFLSSDLVLLS